MATAKKTYYLNSDKSKALPAESVKDGEDDTPEGAAYLLVRAGGPVSDEDVKRYGVAVKTDAAPIADEPNVVISGGVSSGPGVVKGEALTEEAEQPQAAPRAGAKGAPTRAK